MPDPQAIAASVSFPPPPWRLEGELDLAIWLVPAQELVFDVPAGWRPVTLFGGCVVGGVWARYGPGGDLSYRELAVGVAIRRGLRLAVTLPWIWVDSATSLAGGRTLWAIPKRLASFRRDALSIEAFDQAGRLLAAGESRPGLGLPGGWPAAFTLVQPSAAGVVSAPARLRGRLALASSRWRTSGPLHFLDKRPPLLSLRLERAALCFGRLGRH